MLTLILIAAIVLAVALFAALRWRRHELDTARARLVDFAVRLRNHLLGGAGLLLAIAPELAEVLREVYHDPDFTALLPAATMHWIGVVLLLLGAYARFRPGTRADDPEVLAKAAIKETTASGAPVQVLIGPAGGDIEHHLLVPPKGRG